MAPRISFLLALLVAGIALTGCQTTGDLSAAEELDRKVDLALETLYDTSPSAKMLSNQAKGILVFPSVTKAGFIGGGQYGKGALRENGQTVGYYDIIAASYGLQAGIQKFGYALFFMTDEALNYLQNSKGWEVGVGPSIVVVDAGMGRALTTTTAKEDVYAFIFSQKGLMAGIGIQGSKISRINP